LWRPFVFVAGWMHGLYAKVSARPLTQGARCYVFAG
jgi:hypothetical protein